MLSEKSISRIVILHLIAVFFVIFNISDIKVGGFSKVIPLFDLMIIFYFAVFNHIFGLWFIFLLGIWNDALNGNPIGLTAICYILLVKIFVLLNHKMISDRNFKQLWRQFAFFCACFLLLKWFLLSVLNSSNYGFNMIIVQFILTCSFYVIMHKFFDYIHQKLVSK